MVIVALHLHGIVFSLHYWLERKIRRAALSYLSQVDDVAYRADHAGSARAKHLFDPLLLQGNAQLTHC